MVLDTFMLVVPDCAGVLVSWTVPDSFIHNFFVRHTAHLHTLIIFRYVSVVDMPNELL